MLPEAAEAELTKRLANVPAGQGVVLVLSDPAHPMPGYVNPFAGIGELVALHVSTATGVAHVYDEQRNIVRPEAG